MDPQESNPTIFQRLKRILIGRAKNPEDQSLFHHLSLIAFFAWVGLGADGLSSSCYGPEEAFMAVSTHPYLALFVGLGTVATIFVISTSYSQIIELFPSGGGGYLVATKLLSPSLGALSGCALLVDYILTITISIASGADALFSFFDPSYSMFKFPTALVGVCLLTLMNVRGVKESVLPLVPIFLVFVITHAFVILYAIFTHIFHFDDLARNAVTDVGQAWRDNGAGFIGVFVLLKIVLKAYSMGAGTFTGIEAVSNGLQIFREPRVQTAKRTMRYMAFSLAVTVMGLMIAYLLYEVHEHHVEGKTLNAVLFERLSAGWGYGPSRTFVFVTLLSEAMLLFIAAQAGFMDGPRVSANMALDSWLPKRFATLSDRFVTQNGVLFMGAAGALVLFLAHSLDPQGVVRFLVVLYSINVFITFTLSQAGMVRHWWQVRRSDSNWKHKFLVNGVGLVLCAGILISIVVIKFAAGAWITLAITSVLVIVVMGIRHHYRKTGALLKRLDGLVRVAESTPAPVSSDGKPVVPPAFDPSGKTAVVLVNGFSGVGLHTLFSIVRLFSGIFKNFVFVQVGAIDAGVFKGAAEIAALKEKVADDGRRYVDFMQQNGFYAEAVSSLGVDIVQEAVDLAPKILEKFPQSVFFGGQLVFPNDSWLIRFLHNYTVFALQRKFYLRGIPFVILPIRV
ncbi:MAG: APC family permease [Phycisphaeraceae bacterium]|nr:APC family permease [Phycisphaeraceae bacterium]